ncbi:hypothetical protein KH5H1_57460 [Corallococcus caeni]|uniref:Integral membrane protein n=2 Tax=Corallococcus TaxID=83461 RepID=A0A7Y4JZC2_9BACT|nr:hypothetical protein [Corallococcus exercitus]NOK13971.1 hypothetical protein [Corallococcus exercitus]GMU01626.1 hypothetical protein KH5H1_57460 [Corallococcus sp. KH5-1]GMU06284.1 hypothetical protein ASNO1_25370 [Corallococcus sp. NO1]
MSVKNVSGSLLRRALLLDGVASGAMGLLMAVAAGPLGPLLGLEPGLLRAAGLGLIPFALLLGYLAARETLPSWPVWFVVAVNALWVVDSVLLMTHGPTAPTGLGVAFVTAQALAVAVFAALEYAGLRRGTQAALA